MPLPLILKNFSAKFVSNLFQRLLKKKIKIMSFFKYNDHKVLI